MATREYYRANRARCIEYAKEYQRRKKERGVCTTCAKRPPAEGRTKCQSCLLVLREECREVRRILREERRADAWR